MSSINKEIISIQSLLKYTLDNWEEFTSKEELDLDEDVYQKFLQHPNIFAELILNNHLEEVIVEYMVNRPSFRSFFSSLHEALKAAEDENYAVFRFRYGGDYEEGENDASIPLKQVHGYTEALDNFSNLIWYIYTYYTEHRSKDYLKNKTLDSIEMYNLHGLDTVVELNTAHGEFIVKPMQHNEWYAEVLYFFSRTTEFGNEDEIYKIEGVADRFADIIDEDDINVYFPEPILERI